LGSFYKSVAEKDPDNSIGLQRVNVLESSGEEYVERGVVKSYVVVCVGIVVLVEEGLVSGGLRLGRRWTVVRLGIQCGR